VNRKFAIELGDIFRKILLDNNLTQQTFADIYMNHYAGTKPTVTREHIGNICVGGRYPSNALLERVDALYPGYDLLEYCRLSLRDVGEVFFNVPPKKAREKLRAFKEFVKE
jgi:hypothetical protein